MTGIYFFKAFRDLFISDNEKDRYDKMKTGIKLRNKTAFMAAAVILLLFVGFLPRASAETVRISAVDELIAAIRPGAEIVLEEGIYDLTYASTYGGDTGNSSCYWNQIYSGEYELVITGVEDLRITGEHAEIVTRPRSANVLRLLSCRTVDLTDLKVGHTEATEACEGGVIRLENCNGIELCNCALYGCGTIGVDAMNCVNTVVQSTDIYHCSSAGVSLISGDGLKVSDCSIYDCGSDSAWGKAYSIFSFNNSKNIELQDCRIYSNNAAMLIDGYGISNVQTHDLKVYDNRFDTLFGYKDIVEFYDLNLVNNRINSWYSDYGMPAYGLVMIDGEGLTKGKLDERFGEQLTSRGIGTVEVNEAVLDYEGTREVHVSNVDEFLAAIASDTTVYIDVPQLNLTEASDFGKGSEYSESYFDLNESSFTDSPYRWVDCYDGYGLWIGGIRNFHIVGEAEIITTPRYTNVLSFVSCEEISLDKMTLGHTPEGYCAGGVLYFQNCRDVVIDHADLYGCGTLGIEAANTMDLMVQNTLIHDCSYGAVQVMNSARVNFLNCSVLRCPSKQIVLNDCDDFSWNGTRMDPCASFDVE